MTEQQVEAFLAEAREVYGDYGKAERALPIVERALALAPDSVEGWNLKGSILYDLDRDDEAEVCHRRAVEIEPCSVEGLHGLANIANDAHAYPAALGWAEQALACVDRDPHQEFRENEDYRQRLLAQVYIEQAFAHRMLGHDDLAVQILTVIGPAACPMEVETFEEEQEWLLENPEGE
jgi:tetratricopeptide (TPR) repeat protein